MACIITYKGQEFTEQTFADYVKQNKSKFFKEKPDVDIRIDRSAPGGAVAEEKFKSTYKGMFTTTNVTYTGAFSKAGAATERLKSLNADVALDATDPNNSFYTKAGKKLAHRMTNFITEKFSSTEKSERLNAKTVEEWAANKYYRSKGINTDQPIKYEDGKTYTYPELVTRMREQFKENTINGSIVHAIIESYINPSAAVNKKLADLYAQTSADAKRFRWINDEDTVLNLLMNTLDFNLGERFKGSELQDIASSEVQIGSDILGIGTTVDLLVEHSNNSFSIVDFKTGSNFVNDQFSPEYLKFSETVEDIIRDSKLDKAKMELMLRALMIKEQIPEARFRDLKVVHLNKNIPTKVYDVGMDTYLKVLENYYRSQDPATYNALKAKGLFSYENYTTSSKTTDVLMSRPEYANKDLKQVMNTAEARIRQIQEKYTSMGLPEDRMSVEDREEIKKLTRAVLEAARTSKAVDFDSNVTDISWWDRWFGIKYDQTHPVVQTFLQLFEARQQAATIDLNTIKAQQNIYMDILKDEYYQKYPDRKVGNLVGIGGLRYHDEQGDTGFFDFMWEQKTVGDVAGHYRRIITKEDVTAGRFTQAQYDYNKWYGETLKRLWNNAMEKEAYGGKTNAELILGGKLPFDENFMPRYPKSPEEIREAHGPFSKKSVKAYFKNQMDMFVEQQYTDQETPVGIPVKYLGSPGLISNQFHTFNTEQSMVAFAENMIRKARMDDVYALGKGTMTMLVDQGPGNAGKNLPRTVEWLQDYLRGQLISNRDAPIDMYRQTRGIDIKIPGTKVNFTFPFTRSLEGMNNGVTASIMWLNPVNATFNTLQILLYNFKEALVGEILKHLGKEYNYSFKDFVSATNEWFRSGMMGQLNHKAKGLSGDFEDNDKMHGFIRMMRYDTKTFKTAQHKGDLKSAQATLLNKDRLFLLHSIGEEFGVYTNMIALLKAKKIQDGKGTWIKVESDGSHTPVSSKEQASSMWDAYDMKDGLLTYRGPQRGVLADGTILAGLTANEIAGLKRVSQRINGSYREDEKCALELHIFGRMLMKFRKYLPSVIANNFQRSFKDWSLGQYKQLYDANGDPVIKDGQNVYDWQLQVNEGRMRVFVKFLLFSMGTKRFKGDPQFQEYSWSKMSNEQRRQVVDTLVAFTMYGLMATAGMAYYDDEDKKTKGYRKFLALQENMAQILPVDLLRTLSSGPIQFKMAYDIVNAFWTFLFDGLIMGDVVKTGPNEGKLKGLATLEGKIPIINLVDHADDAQDLFGEQDL